MMKYILSILLVMMLPIAGSAQTYYECGGPVTVVNVSGTGGGGGVLVSGMGGIVQGYLCSLTNTAPNGIYPEACKAMYARLLLAKLTGEVLWIQFHDNLTCTTQPIYGWLMGYSMGPYNR